MRNISSIILVSKRFYHGQLSVGIVLFSEKNVCIGHQETYFQSPFSHRTNNLVKTDGYGKTGVYQSVCLLAGE